MSGRLRLQLCLVHVGVEIPLNVRRVGLCMNGNLN